MSGLRTAARTDVGRTRDRNEDSHFAGKQVFAVADGLGGHNAGDVASALAIKPIEQLDRAVPKLGSDRLADGLVKAVVEANRLVYQRAQADAKVRGMGTTLTAIAIGDGQAHLAHVGDSRCYLIRGPEMSQLSTDHTLVARMVAEGKLTQEQAEVHPQRSILTRALGAEPEIDVDTLEIQLLPGDRILLCSDGLSSIVSEDHIRTVIADAKDLDEACRTLIDDANANGGPDNITVVAVEITGAIRVAAASPSAPAVAAPVRAEAAPRPAEVARRRRLPVRPLVWIALIVVLGLGSWIGFRSWVNGSFFVGVVDGRVAIFRGLPTEFAGVNLSRVEERSEILLTDVPDLYRPRLEEGIRVANLTEARDVIERVARGGPATPSPNPSASPTPAPT